MTGDGHLRAGQRARVLAALALLVTAPPLFPGTIDVDGGCTLADAITAANEDTATGACPAGSGADEIRLFHEVTLDSPLPLIANTSVITVRGNGFRVRRSPAAPDFRIFEIPSNGDLTLENVTVSGGSGPVGAGIYTKGDLTVLNSTLRDNHAFTHVGAGAIDDRGSGTTLIRDSILTNNSGTFGGAVNGGDFLIVERSQITGNHAVARGGAIHQYLGQLTITDSTISGNYVAGDAGAPGHYAGGGIFFGFGPASLTNTTVSGNTIGQGNGGGLFNYYGDVTLTNTTVAGNSATSGSAIYTYLAETILENSALSGSCSGQYDVVDGGNNFGCGLGVLTGLDPILDDNGGPTPTHALEPGSSAIDAAGACATPADQRGFARNGACDSGAFEFAGVAPNVGGASTGLDTFQVVCANRTTGVKATIRLAGAASWDCEDAGVPIAIGDSVAQILRGEAVGATAAITGSVGALRLETLVCENRTTSSSTTVFPAGLGKSWDCTAAGMGVGTGDRVQVTLRGKGE